MGEVQQERLKRIGAISHSEMVDKHIGLKGTPERDAYEQEFEKEMKKQNKKLSDRL